MPEDLQEWVARHPWRVMGMIVALAVVLRVGAIYYASPPDHVHATELSNVAGAILAGRGIADAYGVGTGPTAHASPVYPVLLAGVYSLFGFGERGAVAQNVFGLVQVVGIFLLMLPLCGALELPPISGLAGALLFSIPVSSTSERGDWEAPLSAVTIMAAVILALGWWKRDTWLGSEGAAAGLFCGIALLIMPALAPWFAILMVTGLVAKRGRMARFAAVTGLVTAVVLAPWVIRNYRVLGAPIWSRSNFGLEMWMSHNDRARTEFQDLYNSGAADRMHPLESEVERRKVSEMGEVAYNREKLHAGLEWAYAHPRREAELLGGRIFHFWFATLHRRAQTAIAWGLTLLGLAGLVTWGRGSAGWWVVVTLFLTFPLVYYLHSASNRHFYPLIPVVMVLAGDFVRRGLVGRVRVAG